MEANLVEGKKRNLLTEHVMITYLRRFSLRPANDQWPFVAISATMKPEKFSMQDDLLFSSLSSYILEDSLRAAVKMWDFLT
jgi:hypothetical protein